ncbi:hypothetical protein AB0N06_35345 [Streptomyces sp. NPDC051020]|uniref:hypothetical protein n=1 Tax=Streptomyces sp. NPDC051020 TaxID=3155409 RepID=UPI00342C92C1
MRDRPAGGSVPAATGGSCQLVPGARAAVLTAAAFTAVAFAVTARALPPRRKALTETT